MFTPGPSVWLGGRKPEGARRLLSKPLWFLFLEWVGFRDSPIPRNSVLFFQEIVIYTISTLSNA